MAARIAELVKLLASSSEVQRSFLRNTSENAAVANYSCDNDIARMVALYTDSWQPSETDASEEYDHWLARTQIPEELVNNPNHIARDDIRDLMTVLTMMQSLNRPYLFTRHGLRSAYEWKLVRRLSGQLCEKLHWSSKLEIDSFDELWRTLGSDMVQVPQPPTNT